MIQSLQQKNIKIFGGMIKTAYICRNIQRYIYVYRSLCHRLRRPMALRRLWPLPPLPEGKDTFTLEELRNILISDLNEAYGR